MIFMSLNLLWNQNQLLCENIQTNYQKRKFTRKENLPEVKRIKTEYILPKY